MIEFISANFIIDHTVNELTSWRTDISWKKLQEDVKLCSEYGIEKEEKVFHVRNIFSDNETYLKKVNIYYLMIYIPYWFRSKNDLEKNPGNSKECRNFLSQIFIEI